MLDADVIIHFVKAGQFSILLVNVKFDPKGESRLKYARLRSSLLLGKGERACMVYCRDNQDVLGSSNLKDIKEYCANNRITTYKAC